MVENEHKEIWLDVKPDNTTSLFVKEENGNIIEYADVKPIVEDLTVCNESNKNNKIVKHFFVDNIINLEDIVDCPYLNEDASFNDANNLEDLYKLWAKLIKEPDDEV